MQETIKARGLKVLVIFEGRDAAGKGGCISRIASAMSPRICRVSALSAPTEKEKSQARAVAAAAARAGCAPLTRCFAAQWFFQRYTPHLPSAGEMVLFDRSWYNRAGVEHVMGFCTPEQYERFMLEVPAYEDALVASGTIVIKARHARAGCATVHPPRER